MGEPLVGQVSVRRLVCGGGCAKGGICRMVAAAGSRRVWAAAGVAGTAIGGRSPWSCRPCPSFEVRGKLI